MLYFFILLCLTVFSFAYAKWGLKICIALKKKNTKESMIGNNMEKINLLCCVCYTLHGQEDLRRCFQKLPAFPTLNKSNPFLLCPPHSW